MPPKDNPDVEKTVNRESRRESKATNELSAAKEATIKDTTSPGVTASGIATGGLEKHLASFKVEMKALLKTLDVSMDNKIAKRET